ncbi:hypothetical protein ACFUAC_24575 [Streptomyces sp. NPDC057148]|uniref:hypothetical protein n=1 Tax=unclassified Streptomyces TaxID=2593676 RepID=UPI003638C42A
MAAEQNPAGQHPAGHDALMAAITGEPLPPGAGADAHGEYRSAAADVALLREQLDVLGRALGGPAPEPRAAAPVRATPVSRPRRRSFRVALGVLAAACAGVVVTGLGWLVVQTGGGTDDTAGQAASDAQRDESVPDQTAGLVFGTPRYLACARLVAEGTVTGAEPVPGEARHRITLRVTRSYVPGAGTGPTSTTGPEGGAGSGAGAGSGMGTGPVSTAGPEGGAGSGAGVGPGMGTGPVSTAGPEGGVGAGAGVGPGTGTGPRTSTATTAGTGLGASAEPGTGTGLGAGVGPAAGTGAESGPGPRTGVEPVTFLLDDATARLRPGDRVLVGVARDGAGADTVITGERDIATARARITASLPESRTLTCG